MSWSKKKWKWTKMCPNKDWFSLRLRFVVQRRQCRLLPGNNDSNFLSKQTSENQAVHTLETYHKTDFFCRKRNFTEVIGILHICIRPFNNGPICAIIVIVLTVRTRKQNCFARTVNRSAGNFICRFFIWFYTVNA